MPADSARRVRPEGKACRQRGLASGRRRRCRLMPPRAVRMVPLQHERSATATARQAHADGHAAAQLYARRYGAERPATSLSPLYEFLLTSRAAPEVATHDDDSRELATFSRRADGITNFVRGHLTTPI